MASGMDAFAEFGDRRRFFDLTRKYRESTALRARAASEPHAVLAEHGVSVPPERNVRIVANTAETVHLIMPPDPNATLADEQLAAVAGGDGNLDSSQKNAQNTATGVCAISCVSSVSTFG